MPQKILRLMIAFVVAVLSITLLIATFAGSARVVAQSAADPVTITYWHHNSGDRGEYLDQLIAEFNATNDQDITVQGVYMGGYDDIYTAVISGLQGTDPLPNLVVAYPNSFADFARYGRVRFLDDYIGDPLIGIADTEDFYPGVLDYYNLAEYGGQTAGLQSGRSLLLMYYSLV